MSTEGTSDVLLDMSATIPRGGSALVDAGGSEFKVKPRAVEYVRPFGDRLVVLPDSPEELVGSLYVPDTAQERPARGTVVACGPDVDVALMVGMKVIYGHFTGSECLHAGKECLIMRVADLYGEVVTELV